MASTTTCPRHTLTPGRTHSHSVHTLYNSGYRAVTICCSVISELQFGFAVSLVSAAAANKIHIGAAAPILMALFITTRVPSVVNQAGREKGEGGTQKKRNYPLLASPLRWFCDQRESIGHFSPIAVPFETSRACNRAFKCPPSTSTARFVKQ